VCQPPLIFFPFCWAVNRNPPVFHLWNRISCNCLPFRTDNAMFVFCTLVKFTSSILSLSRVSQCIMINCVWPSWCTCHSLSLASVKPRLVLPFWCRLTWVVPEKEPLNGCVCVMRPLPRTCKAVTLSPYIYRKWNDNVYDTSSAWTNFSLGGQTRRVGGWTLSGKLILTLTSC